MKLQPLHEPKWVAEYILSNGEYPGARMTGQSTAQALNFIASAIRNPGVGIVIVDHHGTTLANIALGIMIDDMIAMLNLKHMRVFKHKGRSPILMFGNEA